MVNEGYLIRYQGKGTFVSKAKRNENIIFSESDNDLKRHAVVKIIACELENDPCIKEKLGLMMMERYYRIARLKFDNNKPYALQISHIPARYFASQLTIKNSASALFMRLLRLTMVLICTPCLSADHLRLTDAAPEVLRHLELSSPARYHDETLYPRRARSGD